MDDFASHVVRARKAVSLTQADLARSLGLVRSAVCNWEKGRNTVEKKQIPSLAAALEVEPVEVLSWLLSSPSQELKPRSEPDRAA